MVVRIQEQPQHMVLSNVSWETFEKLLDEIGETHLRAAYLNGDLEFMTISLEHDHYGRWLGRLIFFIALELKVSILSGGSTTLKSGLTKVGLEPDECFWIKNEKLVRGKKQWNALIDPPPDLAVEVDISSSWLDRLGIYAALGVPEVWRYDGEKFRVLILGSGGKYRERAKSLAFPSLPIDGFVPFIARVDTTEEIALIQEFIAWLRTEVLPKQNGAGGRKNGSK